MRNSLLEYVLEAHGGLSAWQKMRTFAADLSIGGFLWDLKCRSTGLANVHVSASLFVNVPGPERVLILRLHRAGMTRLSRERRA
jgi:hypothetical protein